MSKLGARVQYPQNRVLLHFSAPKNGVTGRQIYRPGSPDLPDEDP